MDYVQAAASAIAIVKEGIALFQQARGGLSETDQAKIDADMQAAVSGLNAQQASVDQALDQAEQQG